MAADLSLVGRPPSRVETRSSVSLPNTARQHSTSFSHSHNLHSNQHSTEKVQSTPPDNRRTYTTRRHSVNQSETTGQLSSQSRTVTCQSQKLDSDTPTINRPSTAKYKQRQSVASYVDELLFAPMPEQSTFRAPWDKQSDRTQHVFDCTDYKTSRPPHPTSRLSTPRKHYSKQPSFVDEGLFGDKSLEPATWRAPWQPKETVCRPLLFDARDYRITVQHSDMKNNTTNTSNKRPWH